MPRPGEARFCGEGGCRSRADAPDLRTADLSPDEWLLNAAWGPGAETLETCAERLDRFLRAIAAVDSSLASWQRSGDRSRTPITPDALVDMLASGTHRTDDPSRRPIPALGWTIGLFNRLRDNASQMTITCGSTDSQVGNSLP